MLIYISLYHTHNHRCILGFNNLLTPNEDGVILQQLNYSVSNHFNKPPLDNRLNTNHSAISTGTDVASSLFLQKQGRLTVCAPRHHLFSSLKCWCPPPPLNHSGSTPVASAATRILCHDGGSHLKLTLF